MEQVRNEYELKWPHLLFFLLWFLPFAMHAVDEEGWSLYIHIFLLRICHTVAVYHTYYISFSYIYILYIYAHIFYLIMFFFFHFFFQKWSYVIEAWVYVLRWLQTSNLIKFKWELFKPFTNTNTLYFPSSIIMYKWCIDWLRHPYWQLINTRSEINSWEQNIIFKSIKFYLLQLWVYLLHSPFTRQLGITV